MYGVKWGKAGDNFKSLPITINKESVFLHEKGHIIEEQPFHCLLDSTYSISPKTVLKLDN